MKFIFFKNLKNRKLFSHLLVVLLCIPLLFINFRNCHDWGDDFAQYIHQAKNIIESIPQSSTGYVYSPHNAVLGPPAYLIGFPLVLSPVYYFFGNNILAFLTFINICLILLAVFVFRFYINKFSLITSLILVLIFTYNPWLLNFKAEIMSEIPFTLLLFVILELYNKKNGNQSIFWQIITGLLIGLLTSMRPTGAVFILTIFAVTLKSFIDNFRNGKKKAAWEIVIYNSVSIITAVLFFFLLNKVFFQIPTGAVSSYSHIFKMDSLIITISQNLANYFETVKCFFLTDNLHLKFASIFTQSAFLVFAVIGWAKKVIAKPTFIDILVPMFVLLILVYPYTGAGLRFLLPFLPFFLYYAALTTRDLLMPMNFKYKKIIIIFIGISVLIQYRNSVANIIKNSRNIVWGPQNKQATEAFDFIKNNLPINAVIEFEKPRALSLYTGRKGFHVNNTLPVDTIKTDLIKADVSYILDIQKTIENYPENNLKLYILINAGHLKTIWSNTVFTLYKIDSSLKQSLEEFKGLTNKSALFQSIVTYDTVSTQCWQNINPTSEVSFSGKKSGILTKDMTYGLTYKTKKIPEITQKNSLLFFKSYFLHNAPIDCKIVVSINERDKNTYYKAYNLNEILKQKNQWEKVELLFELPKVNTDDYEFAIYLWNNGSNNLYIDDFEFRIY